jgi:uncharacterized protein involved in exopolysaccharide biosynthesis
MSTFHSQGPGRDALGRLLQSGWRYKWLLAVVVLVGVLLGYGWAARQPTVYEGVYRVRMAYRCPDLCTSFRRSTQVLLSSSAVVQRAVKLSGSRISAETLRQRLEVEVAQDTDAVAQVPDGLGWTEVIAVTIRVVDSTAKGAAQLANAVMPASRQVLTEQQDAAAKQAAAALARRQRRLQDQLDGLDQRLAADPGNRRLQADRDARAQELNAFADQREALRRITTMSKVEVLAEQAALPEEPVQPRPLPAAAIGGLLGLVVGTGLAWWRSRPSGTLTMTGAGGR